MIFFFFFFFSCVVLLVFPRGWKHRRLGQMTAGLVDIHSYTTCRCMPESSEQAPSSRVAARQGKARQGKARQDKARPGQARQANKKKKKKKKVDDKNWISGRETGGEWTRVVFIAWTGGYLIMEGDSRGSSQSVTSVSHKDAGGDSRANG
ncbi:uncharacterized protein IWZ02DRAFT_31685 [Phyllosticta citriasiana]|uniref:uncharacterized protein n=1 Tax=Phyllosticta citriasiana TaxID=595635 RepID=UPI0030FDE22C